MFRRNEFDVQNRVNTTDPAAVAGEVARIFQDLYQTPDAGNIGEAFADITALYRGGCDMNSRFRPPPVTPEIPNAFTWSGNCGGWP